MSGAVGAQLQSLASKKSEIRGNLPNNLKDTGIGDLTEKQRKLASALLVEQADAFAKDDDLMIS